MEFKRNWFRKNHLRSKRKCDRNIKKESFDVKR
jgi:hypothetical protein